MALVLDPDFNIIQQSHGLLVIAKLLVLKVTHSSLCAKQPTTVSADAITSLFLG